MGTLHIILKTRMWFLLSQGGAISYSTPVLLAPPRKKNGYFRRNLEKLTRGVAIIVIQPKLVYVDIINKIMLYFITNIGPKE